MGWTEEQEIAGSGESCGLAKPGQPAIGWAALTGALSMPHLGLLQESFERAGLRPTERACLGYMPGKELAPGKGLHTGWAGEGGPGGLSPGGKKGLQSQTWVAQWVHLSFSGL